MERHIAVPAHAGGRPPLPRGDAETALAAYEVATGIGDLGQQAWAMAYAANAYFGVPDPERGLEAAELCLATGDATPAPRPAGRPGRG